MDSVAAVLAPGRDADVELVSRDFVRRVEDLIAQYGDSAAAMKELAAARDRIGNRAIFVVLPQRWAQRGAQAAREAD